MSISGRQDQRAFEDRVAKAFVAQDFATLEDTATALRESKDRFPDGAWTLDSFYNALGLRSEYADSFDSLLDRWKEAYPASVTVRIVESNALHNDSADSSQFKLDRSPERYAEAEAALEHAGLETPPPSADWQQAVLYVAYRKHANRGDFEQLFARATASERDYIPFYVTKAVYLRKYGKWGEWEDFALDAGRRNLSGEGMGIYSRIAWDLSDGYGDKYLTRYSKISWPKMRDGFREMEKAWPDSEWNLNAFCRFACFFNDKETARELFARIPDDRWTSNWLSHAAFKNWRDWATASGKPAAEAPMRLSLPDGEEDDPQNAQGWSVHFSPDGASLFAGYCNGRLLRFNLEDGSIQWRTVLGGKAMVDAIEVSPDGNWLAVGVGSRRRWPNTPGVLGIWDLRNAQLKPQPDLRFPDGACGVHAIAFSPDGSLIAASGLNQIVERRGELRIWTFPDARQIQDRGEMKDTVSALAFLPGDNHSLAFTASKSFFVGDAASWKHVFWPEDRELHQTWTWALTASPDGKTLACAAGDGYEERDHPGEATFWDTQNWTVRDKPHITGAGGLAALRYSADGRWLVGGGYDGILRVWDASTGKVAASWPPEHSGNKIESVAFAPDGHAVAVARDDEAVAVYLFNPSLPR